MTLTCVAVIPTSGVCGRRERARACLATRGLDGEAEGGPILAAEALRQHPDRFLRKPYSTRELLAALGRCALGALFCAIRVLAAILHA